MPVLKDLIYADDNGGISFGNYGLNEKTKADGFELNGDIYKVKTFKEITKLEKNGLFVYESVPGTTVKGLKVTEKGMEFTADGGEAAQITVELEPDCEYRIFVNGTLTGNMKTNLSAKLVMSVELGNNVPAKVLIEKAG